MAGCRHKYCPVLVAVVALAALTPALGQQTTDPFTGLPGNSPRNDIPAPESRSANEEPHLVFRSRTVLVQVPAVVTDKSGNHIHDLTKADFKVLENGRQQKISLCEEITPGVTNPAPVSNQSGIFSNVSSDGDTRPLMIIALDTINTPFLDQANGRKQLIEYLTRTLDSRQRIALFVIGEKGVRVLNGIDGDPATFLAALKKVAGEVASMENFTSEEKMRAAGGAPSALLGPTPPGGDPGEKIRKFILYADAVEAGYKQDRAVEDTMRAFLAIAWSLSGVPGRKSLLWLTGSFPFALDSPSSVPGGGLATLYERTMDALNDAQISVYPIDIRGLVNISPMADLNFSGGVHGDDLGQTAQARSALQDSSLQSLQNFAEMTGGRAYFNNNDLATGFKRAEDDASSYYLLSYYGDSHNTEAGWHKLKVEVSRKGVEVRARTGFLVTNTTSNPQLMQHADIAFALSSPFDSTGVQVTARWKDALPGGDKRKIGFVLQVPSSAVVDEADQNRFNIDFVVQISKDGAPIGDASQNIKGTLAPAVLAKMKSEGFQYNNDLELPPGQYQTRFVVRDNLRGKIGSVTAPLTVR